VPRGDMIGKTARDFFTPDTAEKIAAQDRYVIEGRRRLHLDEHLVELRSNERRIAVTTRLPILGEGGEPRYLLTVTQDVTEKKRAEARIERLAHCDWLTDLPNRAAFNTCFASVLERAAKSDESFAVMCVNLDRFREINDVFGPSTGDRLLRAVGGA
jgi:predicted signal transduction protein with EAL and GGDEF domain